MRATRLRMFLVAVAGWGMVSAGVVRAQPAPLARGAAWFGCWESADPVPATGVTCVVPDEPAGLRIVALSQGGSRTETVVRLDGSRVALAAEGCEGWQRGRLTPDGERIVIDGETRCAKLPRQVSAGAFVIDPAGEWVSAQGTGLSVVATTQVRRFRAVTSPSDVPVELRPLVGPYLAEGDAARASLVAARLSAGDLLEMERMGVPDAMLDVMVAAGYPESFRIAGGPTRATVAAAAAAEEGGEPIRRPMYVGGTPTLSYFDWMMMGSCGGSWGLMDPIGCGWFPGYRPLGGAFYSPYLGYGRFGAYGPYGYPYGGGIVIQPIDPWRPGTGGGGGGGAGGSSTGGRMVRGRGYVQDGNPGSGGTAQPRNPSGSGGGSVRAEGGSSSGGGSASSGGGAGSAPRTAKPRDP